jgi:hypothetical protein
VKIVLGLLVVALSLPLAAQWLNYPTPGVPRTADGKPNLSAPTPRTAQGKPDFSGMWEMEHNRPCPADGCADTQASQEFLNIGWSLKDGLPYQPWARELVNTRRAGLRKDDPHTHCLPPGIVELATLPNYKKIVQTPDLLVILDEQDVSFRQIFTDGRPLPTDPQPTFNGYSTGKWDGDTLVVTTAGFNDGIWLDISGNPMTDAARITERFRRVNYGNLEIELTVDDPKAYTRPWTVKLHQILVLDTDLLEGYCIENEKDIRHFVVK